MALLDACKEGVWLNRLWMDILGSISSTHLEEKPQRIHANNIGALALSQNPQHHNCTKHIDVQYHSIRDMVNHQDVQLIYIPTEENPADLLTKPLARPRLDCHALTLGLRN